LRLRGPVNVSALGLSLLEIAFLLQDVHHRHDGGIGDAAAFKESFVNLPDCRRFQLPDDFHDFQFLAGKGRFGGTHTKTLVRFSSQVKA
jgi:hypothetical protein